MADDLEMVMTASPPQHNGAVAAREYPAPGFDPSVPNVARVYDWLLGGKDNFAADRAFGQALKQLMPDVEVAASANRAFLGRVVQHLAAAGVTQFIDIGCGLPTVKNTHEVAQAASPGAHAAYVDYHPVVLSHARALLGKDRHVTVVQGDLRDPAAILASPVLRTGIDLAQPVAVLLVAVLHFIADADQPAGIIAAIRDTIAPGSYIAFSHATGDGFDGGDTEAVRDMYRDSSAAVHPRPAGEIEKLFTGLDLIPPGIADVAAWPALAGHASTRAMFLGGIGKVPGPAVTGS